MQRIKKISMWEVLPAIAIKILRKSIYAQKFTAAYWMLEPFGEVGAIVSTPSSQTRFSKIKNKKVIAENQCDKCKKSSLILVY